MSTSEMYAMPIASPLHRYGDWITDSFVIVHRDCPVFCHLFGLINRDGSFRLTNGGATRSKLNPSVPPIIDRALAATLTPARIRETAPHLPSGTSIDDVRLDTRGEPWYVDHGDDLLVFDGARAATAAYPEKDLPAVDEWWLTEAGVLTALPCLVGTANGGRRFFITSGLLSHEQTGWQS
jgi:hypothetical protein